MPETITLFINDGPITVAAGTSVAAAIALAGNPVTRLSVTGMLRAPLCGIGICQECRVTIDGRPHQLACQTLCAPQMRVQTVLCKDIA
ncbi:MAG: (2Fe-2S)-binding protein [Oxalobacteraceae bacterium]